MKIPSSMPLLSHQLYQRPAHFFSNLHGVSSIMTTMTRAVTRVSFSSWRDAREEERWEEGERSTASRRTIAAHTRAWEHDTDTKNKLKYLQWLEKGVTIGRSRWYRAFGSFNWCLVWVWGVETLTLYGRYWTATQSSESASHWLNSGRFNHPGIGFLTSRNY